MRSIILFVGLFLLLVHGVSFPDKYSNKKIARGVTISWQVLDNYYISFLVSCNSPGWLALGFEPFDVGMINADIYVATYREDVESYTVADYYSLRNEPPKLDTSFADGYDNVELFRVYYNKTFLSMEFIRPIMAEDEYDNTLPRDRLAKITYAYSSSLEFGYHQKNRGYVLLDLFSTGVCINACSNNGSCTNGFCQCNPLRTGVDCSAQIPPAGILIQSPDESLVKSQVINSNLTLYWKPVVTEMGDKMLSIWLQSQIKGWVGIGFNPSDRGMISSDMVIASSFGSTLAVGDYWSERNGTPYLDTLAGGTSDIFPAASFSSTGVNLKFARYLVTQDTYDRAISDTALTKVVWAYGPEKSLTKHSPTSRGFLWVDFYNTGACPNDCSGNGDCKMGKCYCHDHYGGEDCTVAVYSKYDFPPMDYKVLLSSDITLYWAYVNSTHIAISMTRENGVGWIGLSFGASDGMTNSDMVICTIVSSIVQCQDYWSTTFTTPQLDTDIGGSNSVSYYFGKVTDNTMTVEFIRPIQAQDKFDVTIPTNDSISIAYAFGDTFTLSKHSTDARNSLNLNFLTGDSKNNRVVSSSFVLRAVHGAVMFFAWGVLLFFGVIWARLTRNDVGTVNDIPKWFYFHRITQYTGFICSLIGWIIAIVMVKVHFHTLYHGQLGLTLICLSIVQVVIVFFRPPAPEKNDTKSNYRYFFELQHVWGGRLMIAISFACIVSGLLEFGVSIYYVIAYAIYVSVALSLTGIYALFLCLTIDKNTYEKEPLTSTNSEDSKITIDPVATAIPVPQYTPAPPSLRKVPPPSDNPLPPPPTSPFTRANENVVLPDDSDDSDSEQIPPIPSYNPPPLPPTSMPSQVPQGGLQINLQEILDTLPTAPSVSPQ